MCASSKTISPVCLFTACVFVAVPLRNAFHKVECQCFEAEFQSTEMNYFIKCNKSLMSHPLEGCWHGTLHILWNVNTH